jgi:hypothetical protein
MSVDRNELYHVVGLFLLAMMTLMSDFSSLTFPASIFGSIAFFISSLFGSRLLVK